ncbi:hypothetical protein BT69DRAFT_1282378 [Atractiella rhizophila]|nr:hypothetical protein BT69DRAFT_1282378 [Atractiella rhizophila]
MFALQELKAGRREGFEVSCSGGSLEEIARSYSSSYPPSNQKLIVIGEGNMGQRNWYQKNWYQASRHASKVVRYISELDVGCEWLELCML